MSEKIHKNVLANNNKICCKYHPDEPLVDDHHGGSMVCPLCGLVVIDQVINEEAEWRYFADDAKEKNWEKSRIGNAANRFLSTETNLNTTISAPQGPLGEYGKTILNKQKRRCADNAIIVAFNRMDEMADRIHLPHAIVDRAQYLYYRFFVKRLYKGNIMCADSKVAACVFLACHQENCPRTLKEICAVSDMSTKQILTAKRAITKDLNIHVDESNSEELLPRFCSQLNLPFDVRKEAAKITRQVKESGGIKCKAENIAAASIYIATQKSSNKRTQSAIGSSIGLSANTISKASQMICKKLKYF